MKPDTLKEQLRINKTALDDEISNQPMLYFDIAEQYEEAAAERDALKEMLATVDAELDVKYRSHYADQKVTEAVIKNAVQLDVEHKVAFDEWLMAKESVGKLGALKEAFQTRGYMLRDLASLYVTGYYETTSVQGTHATDTAVYRERRQILAEARAKK